jgi:hypothetical protein
MSAAPQAIAPNPHTNLLNGIYTDCKQNGVSTKTHEAFSIVYPNKEILYSMSGGDRLCGLVVRVPGYRSGFESQTFCEVVGLEQGSTEPCEYNWGSTWKKQ